MTNQQNPSVQPSNVSLEEFDLVILGGGTGGTLAAWTFARPGAARRGNRAQVYRRLMPQYRLPAQQKYHSQREGCIVPSQSRRIRDIQTGFRGGHARRSRPQTQNGFQLE